MAFDAVDHSILLKKLKLYGITDKNFAWFESYLSNRKQYIEIGENSKTDLKYVTCLVPQGSILEPLLFLVYVKDLPNASRLLDPIMFVDHTNIFFNHKDIKHLFTVVNNELVNIRDWFTANKLSLNVEKTKYSFFHKPSKKDDNPLRLPKLIINNYEIQKEESIKFLGVLLNQHLTWKKHIKLTENKIAKNMGTLYKARPYLDKRALLCLYYSYIHSYLNYANTAWCSTNRTYLKKLQSQQKHAIIIIFHENKFAHTQEHFKENNILNIYQSNIFNNLLFLHRIKNGKAPNVFLSKFFRPSHHYPTRFSQNNCIVPSFKLTKSKYRITIRAPKLWNIVLNIEYTFIEKPAIFKATIKTKLVLLENAIVYF